MSVDIKWETVTSGPDGVALAEAIREFIHDKFQQIPLPRFINSVHVHSFDFGSVCPEIEIKDVCDPLPDFYEDDESDHGSTGSPKVDHTVHDQRREPTTYINRDRLQRLQDQILYSQDASITSRDGRPLAAPYIPDHLAGHFPRNGTPGIPGGTSNIGYFNLPLTGFSGTQTPLAAVASGTPFTASGWTHELHGSSHVPANYTPTFDTLREDREHLQQRQRSTSPARPSTANTIPSQPCSFSPGSPASQPTNFQAPEKVSDIPDLDGTASPLQVRQPPPSQPDDLQVVARVLYAGDIKLTLTAEILLDYPMPSFVGIPLQLNITGVTFDGVAIVAYIRKRMHFCFLSPEDAETLTSDAFNTESSNGSSKTGSNQKSGSVGGLLQEIRVESEIGRKGDGKQSLKNVGKVEKFVLEQVRRIFEEEFVFPSFWTFLV